MSDVAGLTAIEHIVVLMLENRSFDHMLGYLRLEGARTDVNGLRGKESNTYNAVKTKVHHLTSGTLPADPAHDGPSVDEQIANGNGGFVANFAKQKTSAGQLVDDPGLVMGYYNAQDVPVYDDLARQFTICDRWFCSIAGPTIPNRLYALAGTSSGKRINPKTTPPPAYTMPTIFDYLNAGSPPISWRVFASQVLFSQLRLFRNYRFDVHSRIRGLHEFFPLAAAGKLPAVSWLEPNYGIAGGNENDDHPPTDIIHAQRLVGEVYNTLLEAQHDAWLRTLLILVYDEHGGIYDHVTPPVAVDDPADGVLTYGVRVPAFIISPWAPAKVAAHHTYDHASIPKTILERFLADEAGHTPPMHRRIDHARSVASLLSERAPRTDCTPVTLPIARTPRSVLTGPVVPGHRGPPPAPLNEFQRILKSAGDQAAATVRGAPLTVPNEMPRAARVAPRVRPSRKTNRKTKKKR